MKKILFIIIVCYMIFFFLKIYSLCISIYNILFFFSLISFFFK